ncbi:MAG: site-specific integrase [Bacteroides sp.]|nr:site-specific integrase [Bacteroides sp.]
MTLNELYPSWRAQKARQVKESTLSAYSLTWLNKIKPAFGDMDVSTINKNAVRDFVYQQLDSGLSKKTVQDILIVLKMLIRFASEEYEISVHSTNWNIKFPTQNCGEVSKLERYNKGEVSKIMSWIVDNPSPKSLGVAIAINTGMRIGEICALLWSEIDLANRKIRVCRTIERIYNAADDINSKGKTELIISTPKTSSSQREIPINTALYKLLKKFEPSIKPDYYVVSSKRKPLEPRVFRCNTKTLLKQSGIENVKKFHALRHTFASLMIEGGCDVKTVSTILGHSDVATTMNIYVHPSDSAKMNSVNKIMGKLWQV